MLVYKPKGDLSGVPTPNLEVKQEQGLTQATQSVIGSEQQKSIDLLLPKVDGSKVLNAPEAKQADPKVEALFTAQVKTAIPAVALSKYLTALVPMIAVDKAKKYFQLLDLVSRLRVWPLLSRIYLLATTEMRPYNPKTNSDVVMDEIQSLVLAAIGMLPNDIAKTGDQARGTVLAMLGIVNDISKAQIALWKAQADSPIAFGLDEWYAFGPNATKATWIGPVAVNPRVAKFDKGTNTSIYPIPDVWDWSLEKTPTDFASHNPIVMSVGAGLADYTSFGSYDSEHGFDTNNPKFWDKEKSFSWMPEALSGQFFNAKGVIGVTQDYPPEEGHVLAKYVNKGLAQEADAILNDQSARTFETLVSNTTGDLSATIKSGFPIGEYPTGPLWVRHYLPHAQKRPPATLKGTVNLGNPITFGDFIAMSLEADPELGGGSSKTVAVAAASVRDSARQQQAARRVVLKAPALAINGPTNGPYTLYRAAVDKLKSAITNVCYVVPSEWKWEGDLLLQPTSPDWDKWLNDASLKDVAHNALAGKLSEIYQFVYKTPADAELLSGLYGYMLSFLQDSAADKPTQSFGLWDPITNPQLPAPFAFNYDLDKKLAGLLIPTAKASSESIAGLNTDQLAIVGVRSLCRSSTLIAMKASELGVDLQAETESLTQQVKDLMKQIFGGADIKMPPADMPKDQWPKWFQDQMDAAETSPDPDSLLGQLKALLASYDDLKKKADAGDTTAQSQMDDVAEKISALTGKIAAGIGAIASLLKDAVDNTNEEGGTLYWINLSNGTLNKIDTLGGLTLSDGTNVQLGETPEEQQAQQNTANQNAKTAAAAVASMAYISAAATELGKIVNDFKIPVADVVVDNLNTTRDNANNDIPKAQESSWWWLVLLAGAAYAANRK